MHFYWKDRKTGAVELVTILAIITTRNVEFTFAYIFLFAKYRHVQDLIVIPGECEFVRVPQCTTGRVFLLTFKSNKENYFFWAQNAKDDKDEENLARVNRLINDPQGALAENRQQSSSSSAMPGSFRPMDEFSGLGMDQDQLFQILQQHGAFG